MSTASESADTNAVPVPAVTAAPAAPAASVAEVPAVLNATAAQAIAREAGVSPAAATAVAAPTPAPAVPHTAVPAPVAVPPSAPTASARPPVAAGLGMPAAHAGVLPEHGPADATSGFDMGNPLLPLTLTLAGIALVSSWGWYSERRRRRHEEDSLMWADGQPTAASDIVTRVRLSELLPESPDPAEAARAVYVTGIGETNSRREATLIDLHKLARKLNRRVLRGDHVAAVLLLQQHLIDFRYTSPWVFLELRELYRPLGRQKEWEAAREAYRARFGQNAPAWTASVGAETELVADTQLIEAMQAQWPQRAVRLSIIRWMLGDPDTRKRCLGPPLLPLGVYRDLMLLDAMLDDLMPQATA